MFENDIDLLDQHFLKDPKVIDKFIKICDFKKSDIVLEIGAGDGTLTKLIVPNVNKLYVIEKDVRLKQFLDKIDNIDIIYDNVLDVEIPEINKIVTALPYSIIEPFIYKMTKTKFDALYMIMGSNFVYNVIDKKITNLSLITNTYFDAVKYLDIYPESFSPSPKTMSSIIKLTPKKKFNKLDLVFKTLYELDDKKIKNSLMDAFINVDNLTKNESKNLITKLNISEELLEKKFVEITNSELQELYAKIFDLYLIKNG